MLTLPSLCSTPSCDTFNRYGESKEIMADNLGVIFQRSTGVVSNSTVLRLLDPGKKHNSVKDDQ